MNVYFHDKIQLQIILLYHAEEIAALDFKVHKSLEHLNLSANEYSIQRKSVITNEDVRKLCQPDREILYKYHLDLPRCLENFRAGDRTDVVSENVFHLSDIFICQCVYGLGLESFIVEAIISHRYKTEKLRSYMKILHLLNFRPYPEVTLQFYDNLVPVLYRENCSDSRLVIDFINEFNFYWWLFNYENPFVLQYILHHAQRIQRGNNLWQTLQPEISPVNMCFLRHKITNVRILLMYGNSMIIPPEFNFNHYIDIPNQIFQGAVERGTVSYRRAFLIFLLLYDFQHHRQSPEGLQCIWKSIKDPFLCHSELFFTLIQGMSLEMIFQVHCHYATNVSGGSCTFFPYPRKLKHLCRVEVRNLLHSLRRFPHGISYLHIPDTLKPYLNEY